MTDSNFSVKNGLLVNSAISINSTMVVVNTAAININGSNGVNGQILTSTGTSTLWTNNIITVPGGSNTYIQINDSGSFNGSSGLTFNKTSNTLNVTNLNFTGNVSTQNITYGGSVTWNLAAGKIASITLTGASCNVATSNLCVDTCLLHIYQDVTGSRLISWAPNFKWPAGIAPTLSNTANSHDIMTFVCDGTNMYGTYINDVR